MPGPIVSYAYETSVGVSEYAYLLKRKLGQLEPIGRFLWPTATYSRSVDSARITACMALGVWGCIALS